MVTRGGSQGSKGNTNGTSNKQFGAPIFHAAED
jgi:hypothetical protein